MIEISKIPPQSITDKNLIDKVKTQSRFTRPAFYKPLILDILTIISALWFGYAYMQFLGGSEGALTLVISLGIFSIFSTLQIFFTKAFNRRMFIIILQTICILIPFYGHSITYLAVAAGIYMFFTVWGELLAYGELENNIEIRFFKVARPYLKKLTTALVLLMIVLYLPQWDEKRAFIPQDSFRSLYGWAAGVTKSFYPDIDFNSTFISLTRSLARVELQKNQEFKSLTEANKETMIQDISNQIATSTSKSLGIAISAEDQTSDVFYNSIVKLFASLKDRFKESFLLVWALAAFLLIRGLGVIFYWIVMLISFILYELLLTSGWIRILGVAKTHEVIDF